MAKLGRRKRLKISRVIPVWVQIPLSALILFGCGDPPEVTNENRYMECYVYGSSKCINPYDRWFVKYVHKCEGIIKGNYYLIDTNTIECWYKGKISFTEQYKAP